MYKRVLHPTDGSTGTAHVTLQAIDLAKQYGATLYTLSVIDTDISSILADASADEGRLRHRAENAVETVEQMAVAHGVTVETAIREGDPAETILDYADEIGADAIVAGTHGRSGVRRHLLGSVAERLVRHANAPVMTVRLPKLDDTIEEATQATGLAEAALEEAGYEATVVETEQQRTVWLITAKRHGDGSDDGSLLVYLDPRTRRTSIIEE